MVARLVETPLRGHLSTELATVSEELRLFWLGQAGFVIDAGGRRLVIDPYLSDSLAQKYRGTATPHERMMPAPVTVEELGPVDLVLCTHQHTDHMDAATLGPLARAAPAARFVVPAASLGRAREAIGNERRLIPMDAGDRIEPIPGIAITATRAAHETIERDDAGHHRFLGYGIAAGGRRIFHSGDTIPFAGQEADITGLTPDLALLPVNGRSEALRQKGIAGNLTLDEAIALARRCRVPTMIAHHYGMFAFNTADPAEIDRAVAESVAPTVARAKTGVVYALIP